MTSLTFCKGPCWGATRPHKQRLNVKMSAATVPYVPYVKEHFGSNAIEEFEKTELSHANVQELAAGIAQSLKNRGTLRCEDGGFQNWKLSPQALAKTQHPGPSQLHRFFLNQRSTTSLLISQFHFMNAVGEIGFELPSELPHFPSSPLDLGVTLDYLKANAAQLSATLPAQGGHFEAHWGSQVVSSVLDILGDGSQQILHQVVNHVAEKLGSGVM